MTDLQTRVIVGLGNPGEKYARNRHNVGFMVLDELAQRRKLEFRSDLPSHQWASSGDVVLIKPLTYMNLSGEALADWSSSQSVELTGRPEPVPQFDDEGQLIGEALPVEGLRPLIVCDDLALPLGSVRLRAQGRSGGQNGLASAIEHLGGDSFPRLRLGIAPVAAPVPPEDWPDYVLADFAETEIEAVKDLVDHAANALEFWLEHDLERTISRFNRRIRPQA